MCFEHDYDWYAEVNETDEHAVSDLPVRCGECRRVIPPGTPHVHVHQQEREDYLPQDDAGAEIAGPFEEDEEPSCGETFDHDSCLACWKLRKAVEAAEIDEGCKGPEAQPGYGGLREAYGEDDDGRYLARAGVLYPELADEPGDFLELFAPYRRKR